jgi:PAS domain S-box-containing protein
VLDTSSDAVIRFDPGGPIKSMNRQVERISGVPHERWMGRTLAAMGYGDFAHSRDAKSRQVFDTGEALAFGFEIDNAEGHRWYESKVNPEVDAGDA